MQPRRMSTPRHFACTSCGKCCDRGPEIELGEAAALSSSFITRALFRVHSLPLYAQSRRGKLWGDQQDSLLSPQSALEETREHLARFAVRSEVDKAQGRTLHLTISALTLDPATGSCPALVANRCGIYAHRPHTCRTVPLHYSRPVSSLVGYLDSFVATPGYRCQIGRAAPTVLNGLEITCSEIADARADALAQACADHAWKTEIARLMEQPDEAAKLGLPSSAEVRKNSEAGSASLVAMLGPWRVAQQIGTLTKSQFSAACRAQYDLIQSETMRCNDPTVFASLQQLLEEYRRQVAGPTLPALSR
jgi:Fe-S-cluster containining protein